MVRGSGGQGGLVTWKWLRIFAGDQRESCSARKVCGNKCRRKCVKIKNGLTTGRFLVRGVGGSRGSGNLETVKNFRRRPTGKLFGTKSWWKQVSTDIRKSQKWPDHEPFFSPGVGGPRGSGNLETVKNFRRRPTGKLFGTKSWWKQVSTEMRKNQKWPDHGPFFGPGVGGSRGSGNLETVENFRRSTTGKLLGTKSW